MVKDERNEDLNPRSEDIDAKIDRMLDPRLPDEPNPAVSKTETSKIKKVTVSEHIEEPTPELKESASTAPELPPATPPSTQKGKKVIVPITHHEDEALAEVSDPEPISEENIRKIAVAETSESTEEVAEKLDDAIDEAVAELEPTDEVETIEEPTEEAPESPTEPTVDKAEQPLPKAKVVEDPETDQAVKDIISDEADTLLEVEDVVNLPEDQAELAPVVSPKRGKRKNLLFSRTALKIYLCLTIVGLVVAGGVPASRYYLLNAAGIRVSSSVQIVDAATHQPLKNAEVSLDGITSKTDVTGTVKLDHLRLGRSVLKIEKLAFAVVEKPVVLGWGSNPLGEFSLTPTGAQYQIKVSGYLSGQGIMGAEASSNESSAIADKDGLITLTVPETEETTMAVAITAAGQRSEKLTIDLKNHGPYEIKLVPSRKHAYISKRSGAYDIYSVYIDGKQDTKVLKASGYERDDLVLTTSPDFNRAAFVSTRANKRNSDGFLLSNLLFIDLDTNQTTSLATSERIQVIGWSKEYLVYVEVASGDSAADPARSKLMSYNFQTNTSKELARSNYFNDLTLSRGIVYFAPSSAIAGGSPAQLLRIHVDGSNQQAILKHEVWNIFRTSFNDIAVSIGQDWYGYGLNTTQLTKLDGAPAGRVSRIYVDGPNAKNSAWVDQRDGKGTLLVYDVSTAKDATLTAQKGLSYPVVWLDSRTLIYRLDNSEGVADYAISLDGGKPIKVRDVTKTGGIDNWYYY